MPVIAALIDHGKRGPEATQQCWRPTAKSHHDLFGLDRAPIAVAHLPTRSGGGKGHGVGLQKTAAALQKQVGVSLHQCSGIGAAPAGLPVDGSRKIPLQRRFLLSQLRIAQGRALDAIFPRQPLGILRVLTLPLP